MSTLRYPSYRDAPLRELTGQVSNDSFEQQVFSQNSVPFHLFFLTFLCVGDCEEALPILDMLVDTNNFSLVSN